ncbi:YceI family protein [Streptomyces sp. NBC_00841]|uniref:YceI family protein n=1 Tax=Streptomyces sp. NBC_00841 TaxID=2975847 RepID=UPI002DDA000E|nr:YceI family protein [Streptomyces sp. NBC_00841]WRZ96615.1 YceI family protein [Streptomyces sp. NBC_00841]
MFTLPWRRTSDISSGTTAPEGLPLPEGAGRAECQVVDPVGLPMQATVTVLDRAGQPVTEGGTDAYGLFTAAIPPGDYQLSVVCEGFQPHRVPVQVFPGARASAGVIGLVAAPLPPAPAPGRWDIDPHHSAVRFIARHIGLAEIHGRFNRFSGSLWIAERMRDSQIEVYIESDSIDTGVRMRDNHLRSSDFLDVAAYPYLRFSGGDFVHRGSSRWSVTGVLELHGVSRTVKLDTTYLGLGTGMEGEPRAACRAVTELHREDFTLTWQKMLAHGIAAIGATIRIELDIQAVQTAQAGGTPQAT